MGAPVRSRDGRVGLGGCRAPQEQSAGRVALLLPGRGDPHGALGGPPDDLVAGDRGGALPPAARAAGERSGD
eukprot:15470653-Alexandrium_andersonii.AAC.1